jgi:hypothetical protein
MSSVLESGRFLTVRSPDLTAILRKREGGEEIMLWFEYDGPNDEGVTERDTEVGFIRESMPSATSYYYDDAGFTVIIWDTKAGVIETYVFDNGRPTVWYFSPKKTTADAWWRRIFTKGENTGVAARWVRKHFKRLEMKEENARWVNDFILCLEEMRDSGKGSPTWECARSDARDRLVDLCDLAGVPVEEVIGSDI